MTDPTVKVIDFVHRLIRPEGALDRTTTPAIGPEGALVNSLSLATKHESASICSMGPRSIRLVNNPCLSYHREPCSLEQSHPVPKASQHLRRNNADHTTPNQQLHECRNHLLASLCLDSTPDVSRLPCNCFMDMNVNEKTIIPCFQHRATPIVSLGTPTSKKSRWADIFEASKNVREKTKQVIEELKLRFKVREMKKRVVEQLKQNFRKEKRSRSVSPRQKAPLLGKGANIANLSTTRVDILSRRFKQKARRNHLRRTFGNSPPRRLQISS